MSSHTSNVAPAPIPLYVARTGVACPVGLSAAPACAAIRSAIDSFHESRFLDHNGEPIVAAEVPLHLLDGSADDEGDRTIHLSSAGRLPALLERALDDCLGVGPHMLEHVALLLLLPNPDRAGVPTDLEAAIAARIEWRGWQFHATSRTFRNDRAALAHAVRYAAALLARERSLTVVIVGADSFMSAGAINHFMNVDRLQANDNSDGFIPGEAAAAVWLSAEPQGKLVIRSCELAEEAVTITDTENKSAFDGLARAVGAALASAGRSLDDIGARLVSASGEDYFFEELSWVSLRHLRDHRPTIPLWHPADCVGETGAAIGPLLLAVAHDAANKDYAPNSLFLMELSNDDCERAALVLEKQP